MTALLKEKKREEKRDPKKFHLLLPIVRFEERDREGGEREGWKAKRGKEGRKERRKEGRREGRRHRTILERA